MKQILIYLLIAALITLSGCRDSESIHTEPAPSEIATVLDILLTAPPAMTLRCGDQEVSVGSGNYTWNYENEAGQMQSVIACGAAPSSLWEGDPTLVTSAEEAVLTWIVMPDSITVRCWSNARSSDTWDVEFSADVTGNVLTLNPEYQIYEITAAWNSSDVCQGTASYAVYLISQE